MKKPPTSKSKTSFAVASAASVRNGILSTGSTLLNLYLTGDPYGGMPAGHIYHGVGESDAGKTVQCVTILAEAARNPAFGDYRLIYDNPENGMNMDLDAMFGPALAARIEPPAIINGKTHYTETLEEFYVHLSDATEHSTRPCIYVLDSMDVLEDEASGNKFAEKRRKMKRIAAGDDDGEKLAGSYGMARAKINSERLRYAKKWCRKTGSILFIVSQERERAGMYGPVKVYAGGRGPKFYAVAQWWFNKVKDIRKDVRGKERKIGTRAVIDVTKNHLSGGMGKSFIDIYPGLGFDDVGACVDYLVEEGAWSKKGKSGIVVSGIGKGVEGGREKVIRWVEAHGHFDAVRELCGTVWDEVSAAMSVKRVNRYLEKEKEKE